ncbi:cold shock domain-containing protein [Kitasatospora mediocidica]|uniref:cold shock domain-containing protein n=1 Tax=Kitasatospora mediocidica TaxID=58352 RepID=UPI0005696ECC|nr:cold-shock protein [Kitasatospora mediocidica]
MAVREAGVVKWFNGEKGFGFIARAAVTGKTPPPDVFVHYSAVQGTGYKELLEGEQVDFIVEAGPKGPQAVDVRRMGPDTRRA